MFRSDAPVPPAIVGIPPADAEMRSYGLPVLAWGPFALEQDEAFIDFGIMLRDDQPETGGRWVSWDTTDRQHRRKVVGPWLVRGQALRVETEEGWLTVRPIREKDRPHADPVPSQQEAPDLEKFARESFFGEA